VLPLDPEARWPDGQSAKAAVGSAP
jgi:hypothetical protein